MKKKLKKVIIENQKSNVFKQNTMKKIVTYILL